MSQHGRACMHSCMLLGVPEPPQMSCSPWLSPSAAPPRGMFAVSCWKGPFPTSSVCLTALGPDPSTSPLVCQNN